MAVFKLEKRMPYWDMELGNGKESVALLYKKFINSISVEYALNMPAHAEINVTSYAAFEDLFREGTPINIYFGWHPNFLVNMINGVVITRPDGSASTQIDYTISILDKQVAKLTKEAKNRTFPVSDKIGIITYLCSMNGYAANIQIEDINPIKSSNMPIQKNETDAQFLYRCAKKWDCIVWFDKNGVNFFDAKSAYKQNDYFRQVSNIQDILGEYPLGYRTPFGDNNVAKIEWKKYDAQGGVSGLPGVAGADENGKKIEPPDYDIEFEGIFYRHSTAAENEIKKLGFAGAKKYYALWIEHPIWDKEAALKKYFIPITKGISTQKDNFASAGKKQGIEIDVELNYGDPWLRPPRTARIQEGSTGSENSFLPSFIYPISGVPVYNIQKVKTSLETGMIKTSINMTV